MKKTLFVLMLVTLASAVTFASGAADERYYYDGYGHCHGKNSHRGMMNMMYRHHDDMMYGYRGMYGAPMTQDYDEQSLESLEGTFSMAGNYPTLKTSDGQKMYLGLSPYMDITNIPSEGAKISVKGLRSFENPSHFMVVSAAVDGKEIIIDDSYMYRRRR